MESQLVGKRITITSQFTAAVTVEDATLVEETILMRVRTQQGELREAFIRVDQLAEILSSHQSAAASVDANQFFC